MTFACDSPRGADSSFVSNSRLGALSKNSMENSAKAFDATNARGSPISRPRSVKASPLHDATALVSVCQLLNSSSIASQEFSNSQSLSRGRFTPSQPSTQLSSRQVSLAENRPCGTIPSSAHELPIPIAPTARPPPDRICRWRSGHDLRRHINHWRVYSSPC